MFLLTIIKMYAVCCGAFVEVGGHLAWVSAFFELCAY